MTNNLTTNIIRNVYNIGTSSCDAGTQVCTDGYALYFPCLKDITRGQDVCFDFYVADMNGRNAYLASMDTQPISSNNELVDMRDVDALSLNLIGMFNCPYGTFYYPDDITSLQTEKYHFVYGDDFGKRGFCHLTVFMIDIDNSGSEEYHNIQEGDFYSGMEVEVAAYDTDTHIFIGWAIIDNDDEDCPDDTIYDYIVSSSNIYKFTIRNDVSIYAIYRQRKKYNIISDPTNKSSHFNVNYNHIKYPISNRPEEIFDDGFNEINGALEGYHMFVKCVPSKDVFGNGDDGMHEFIMWKDGDTSRCRLFIIGKNTSDFEDGDTIKLKAYCSDGLVPVYELVEDEILYFDEFDEDGIHILTEVSDVDIYDYYCDGVFSIESEEVYRKFIEDEGYLYFHFGTLTLSSFDIKDGIKVSIQAKADDYCEIFVSVNGYKESQVVSVDEFMQYDFYFRKCEKSNIVITTYGDCLIDMIEIYREEIVDKGKAQLCLDSETTANLPTGKLSVNGAIMVNGKSYGLSTVQIGNINKLPKITLNT